jgi:putative serine/threonine protein kinase
LNGEQTKDGSLALPVGALRKEEHGMILCYPGTELGSFDNRVNQLREIGVTELLLEGSSKVGKYGVVGKGCVSIVVKARMEGEKFPVALKIRRADANRPDMLKDYELQRLANSFGVAPRALSATKDLFAMEYIDSMKIGKWFESIKTRTPKKLVRGLVEDMMTQCYVLDINGLDHGELSNPSKHILIRSDSGSTKTVIIDYESASTKRRASNLTAVGAFLFLGGWQSGKLRKILGSNKNRKALSKRKLISLFGEYKQKPNKQMFDNILEYVGV